MKPSYLVLNVVLVVAGLFVYHTLVGAPDTTPSSSSYDHLQGDTVGDLPEDEDRPAIAVLDSGANAAMTERNAARIATLEGLLAAYKEQASGGGDAQGGAPLASAGGQELPTLRELDQVDGEAPQFDERTLASLGHYIDEINRRKMEARNKERLVNRLAGLGVELSDAQTESVVAATLAYQARTREFAKQKFSQDDAGREARKKAFVSLRDEYQATLHTLVPADAAEKIGSSRLTRGFTPGGAFRGGGGRTNERGGRRGKK